MNIIFCLFRFRPGCGLELLLDLRLFIDSAAGEELGKEDDIPHASSKESGNNLIWYDEASSKANAPVSKAYNF